MDLNFEQLLAQHNQEFKESEVFSNWMPDDGEYIVSLVKLDTGTFAKDGVSLPWWRLTGRIEDVQDEKINGKEFSVGYYTSRAFGILKGAVQMLSGEPIDDLAQAHIVLEESIGKVIRAKVETTTSKKNNKDYTNCYIQEVINTEAPAEAVAEAADVTAAPTVEAPAAVEAPAETLADAVPVEAPAARAEAVAEVPQQAPEG